MINIITKIFQKFSNIYFRLFLYPKCFYEKNLENQYWKKRKKSYLSIKPNNFQIERTKIINQYLKKKSKPILFDIGSGDGAQLISIKKTFPNIKIIASDNDEFAINIVKRLGFENFKLKSENDIFNILEKTKPNFITIFEVLEHMKSPEHFLLKTIKLSKDQVFFSVPNSGYITHRLRFLFGKFPLQWIASPNEHLRFWTLKDMQWWLIYLNLKEVSEIVTYKGIPFLNKIFPNLFSEGLFVIIKK